MKDDSISIIFSLTNFQILSNTNLINENGKITEKEAKNKTRKR